MYVHGLLVVVVFCAIESMKHTKQKQNTNTLTHWVIVQKFKNTYTYVQYVL